MRTQSQSFGILCYTLCVTVLWLGMLPLSIHGQVVVLQPILDRSRDESADIGTGEQDGELLDVEDDFFDLDIEQLRQTSVVPAFETVVTSVSRQESTVGRSPAAVFVITNEMILRSGARSIPEALRLAPGLHVAKIDANKWAITSRGFNGRFANKLLVQFDGRSVYTRLFAGVYWDVQDTLLEDVDRIEIIRGPGATVWGSNAVNGVINIITKPTRDTVGAYAQGGGGTEQAGFASARVGGQAADGDLHWRAWGKWFERDSGFRPGAPTFDDWRQGHAGLRLDWTPTCSDTVTVQGDHYQGTTGNATEFFGFVSPVADSAVRGDNLLTRWTHEIDDTSDWSVQAYFDRVDRIDQITDQTVDTMEFDLQHHFRLGDRHNMIWGLGYRNIYDRSFTSPGSVLSVVPNKRRADLVSGFVQDEITLVDDRLFFTVGTKMEHNDYTNFEIQPSGRLLWSLDPRRVVWTSVSRAVRLPSRVDDDLLGVFGGPFRILGSRSVVAEELIAYEIGYRAQPQESFSWDVALFYNDYDNLITTQFAFPITSFTNDMQGESYGAELTGRLELTPSWSVSGSYTFLRVHLHPGPTSISAGVETEGATPRNQAMLWSSWDLGCNWQLDAIARYVDHVPAVTTPHYITMDLRLAWEAREGLEVAIVGQNLLDAAHKEYGQDVLLTQFTEVQRGVYGSLTWRF